MTTPEDTSRRDTAAAITNAHARAEKRRKAITMSAVVFGVAVMIGATAYPILTDDARKDHRTLTDIGPSALSAGCQPPVTKPAEGNNDHRPIGEKITYDTAPPAYGPHYPIPQDMGQKFYTVEDRPAVETLVHNLEHGFTILWYDETISPDMVSDIKAITRRFPNTTGVDDKFIAAPWTGEDGAAFPEGAHVALTHWSVTEDQEQEGVWLYCAKPSGEVVDRFVEDYPFTDAPEGGLPGNMS